MKTRINYILAALVLAAAMNFTTASCSKENPDSLQQGEQQEENNTPQKPVETPEIGFENKEAVFAYIGESVTIDFKAYGKGLSSSKVVFTSDGKSAVEGSFDPQTGKGKVVVKLNEKADHCCSTVTLTVKGGEKNRTYTLDITAYYLDMSAEDITLSGEKGQSAELKYTIDTNITGFEPVIETDAQWLTCENGKLITTEENTTEETREAVVTLSDKEGRFDKAQVKVFQETISVPETKPGCVAFREWNFKKACLAIADSDSDGEISFQEAEVVEELVAVGKGIKDLTGLDAFKNLWKVDLRDNDIEDADILKELHLLHWLDLTGNKNLRTFDLTGCTIYFDYCWFECTEQLQYKLLRHQVGISGGGGDLTSDPWCEHSKHIRDERQTTDWSHQDNLIKVKSHTKTWVKDGQEMEYAICLSGIGYLDVDIEDGTFKRMMDETIENLKTYPELEEKWEYMDIYYIEHMTDNRYKYMVPRSETMYETEEYKWAVNSYIAERTNLERKMWDEIYGENNDINKILICLTINIHCAPGLEAFSSLRSSVINYFASTTDFQGNTTETKPYLGILNLQVSPFMDDENENYYISDMTITNIFKSIIPEGSFKNAVDVLF